MADYSAADITSAPAGPQTYSAGEIDPPKAGFWSSLGTQLSGFNPIPAVKAWLNQGTENAKGADALKALDQIHADAAKDPANKGVPVNRWKTRPATASEQAAIDAGMSAQLPSSSEGAGPTAPAQTALRQAAQGDVGGAAGTLAGAYGVPALIGAGSQYAPAAGRALATEVKQPGTQGALAGLGTAGTGLAAMREGGPVGLILGASKMAKGALQIYKGIKQRASAAENARAAAAAAAPPAELPIAPGSLTIQPQPAGPVAPVAPITAASYAPPVTSTNVLPAPIAPPAAAPAPAAAAPPAAAPPSIDLLNQTARNMGARGFSSLPPEAQDTVRAAVAKYNERSAAGEQTLARPAPTPQTAPAAQPAPTSPAPAPAAWKAGSSAPAATPPPTVSTIPFARAQEDAAAGEAAHAKNADALTTRAAQALKDSGIPHDQAAQMTKDQWDMVSQHLGSGPISSLRQAETLFKLRMLENPRALAAAKAFQDSQAAK